MIRANSPEALAQRITSEVTIGAIRGLRGEALMLHASAVSLDDGRVIGFVGPSGRGKTTASQALGRFYGYVTDETLAVRVDGSVVPYPKPLSIGSWPGVKVTEPASTLGLRRAPAESLRLAAIVLLDRRPDVEQPFVESVPIIEALSELVPPDEPPLCPPAPAPNPPRDHRRHRRRTSGRLLRGVLPPRDGR